MKTTTKILNNTPLLILLSSLLIGCGGSSSTTQTSVKTGYFIDAAVQGLSYKTASGLSGTTNEKGEFQYQSGEKVAFSIGKLNLGSAVPSTSGRVTPKDVSNGVTATEVLILRSLQAIDEDNNTKNGITVPTTATNRLNNLEIERDIADLDESTLLALDEEFKKELDKDGDNTIDVNENEAQAHANESIQDFDREHGTTDGEEDDDRNGQNNDNDDRNSQDNDNDDRNGQNNDNDDRNGQNNDNDDRNGQNNDNDDRNGQDNDNDDN